MADKLKCKLCKKEFPARKGMEKCPICLECDESGKSGILRRVKMVVTKNGEHREGEVLFQGSD